MSTVLDTPHVTDEEIAAYLEGTLDAAGRARVERHTVACDECRAVLTDGAATLAAPLARRMRPKWLVGGAVAAAAVLALLFIARVPADFDGLPVERNGSPPLVEDVGRFAALSPASGAAVDPAELVLAWEPLPEGTVYRVAVSHERGDVVWSDRTEDTSILVPSHVAGSLRTDETYYWRVEALLPDLRTASTPVRSFNVRAH